MKSAATMEAIYRHFPFENRRTGVLKLRKACGLGQCELARAAKVSQAKISRFETGAQDMSRAAFARVQEVLKRGLIAHEAELKNLVPTSTLAGGGDREEPFQSYRKSVEASAKLFGSPERVKRLLDLGGELHDLRQEVLRLRTDVAKLHEVFKAGHEFTNSVVSREGAAILQKEISAQAKSTK
jgi:transcriptional regulator with XRE-family HTH domain